MKLKREIPNIILFILPFAFLAIIWPHLPQIVPTHFNASGDADGFSNKINLIWLIAFIMVLTYGLFLLIPVIDPKRKISQMGNKFSAIKLIIMFFMSVLACMIIYSAYRPEFMQSNALMMLIALLLAAFGNYFKTIKPNYFIGIRTPWTLENETVWKKTHLLAGKIWLIGGIVLFFLGFVIPTEKYTIVVIIGALVMATIPAWQSYRYFFEEKRKLS